MEPTIQYVGVVFVGLTVALIDHRSKAKFLNEHFEQLLRRSRRRHRRAEYLSGPLC